jgi:hypothetical protein
MPPASAGAGAGTAAPMEPETFLASLPDHVRSSVQEFIPQAVAAGAEVAWLSYGPSFKVTRDKTRQVAYFESKRYAATIQASGGFPEEPFRAVAQSLADLGIGAAKSWWHIVPWSEMTAEQAVAALETLLDGIAALTPQQRFEPVHPSRVISFERNDHNLWTKTVPELGELHGRRLRGTLRRTATGDAAEVDLLPLKGDAPGWRPRFPNGDTERLWPAGAYEGAYELRIDAQSH